MEKFHTLVQTNKLAELLGIPVGQSVILPRSLKSWSVLQDILGQGWDSTPFAVIHPVGSKTYKRWHRNGWEMLVSHMLKRGLRIVITGGATQEEKTYVESLGFVDSSVTSLVGKLRFADVTLLLERCSVYVGVDTVISHMAAIAGAPVVALFGPTNPDIWGPWPKHYRTTITPFRRDGFQRVGNVYIIKGADAIESDSDGILELSSASVIHAADVMLTSGVFTGGNIKLLLPRICNPPPKSKSQALT